MLIYRLEKNGIGPYVGSHIVRGQYNPKSQAKAKRIMKKYGWRMERYKEAHALHMVFGCKTKEALRGYFMYHFKSYFAAGYRIHTYNVPDRDVIDLGIEVAFPVKYHPYKTRKKIRTAVDLLPSHR